jgi:tetratricopeptide (TPR) repeat protein
VSGKDRPFRSDGQEVFRLDGSVDELPHAAELTRLWDRAFETGDHGVVIGCLQRALAADPSNAQWHYMLGCSLQTAGTPQQAAAAFRSVIALDPRFAKAHNNLGYVLQADGRLREAVQSYRDAIAADPQLAIAHLNLGYASYQLGDGKQALASLRRATELEPAHADWLCRLGDVLLEFADFDQAISCYRAALRIDRDNADAAAGAVIASRARTWETRAETAAPDRDPAAAGFLQRGLALQRAGDPRQAVQCYESALRLDPADTRVHYLLGCALATLSEIDQAQAHFREALRLSLLGEPRAAPAAAPVTRVPRTTLCCVDCRYHELAIAAIRKSMSQCAFERVVFLTDRRFELPGVEVVLIPQIKSIREYCRFMVKQLGRFVDTEFALVMQYDGFVLNGRRWDERFLDYDYVGAKWSYADGRNVGNGGFSLRSKRLLSALSDERIVVQETEDVAICRSYRDLLERDYGIRFAPEDVADRFSFESVPPPGPTFGFHGMPHLLNVFDMTDEELAAYKLPLRVHHSPL